MNICQSHLFGAFGFVSYLVGTGIRTGRAPTRPGHLIVDASWTFPSETVPPLPDAADMEKRVKREEILHTGSLANKRHVELADKYGELEWNLQPFLGVFHHVPILFLEI